MLRPLVRSFLSAAAAACFSIGAVVGSGMPECAAVHGHDHGGHHADREQSGRPAGHGHTHCVVHLCCADMAPEPPVGLGDLTPGATSDDAGFAPTAAVLIRHPDHSLPFAHAPPRPAA
jgi:hypothetical protein